MTAAPKLNVELIPTFHVDWMTYSWHHEKGICGLGQYAAHCLGIDGELDMFESGNDTAYRIDVSADNASSKIDNDELFRKSRAKMIEKIRKEKGVENWNLRNLLLTLVDAGALQPGIYVVSLSW